MTGTPKRDFLTLADLSPDEIREVLALAARMKAGDYRETPLAGKVMIMIFRKSSTRTRVSFEVGVLQLGGHAIFLSDRDSQIGRGEPIADTAKVLSGYGDLLMVRTFGHHEVIELAEHSTIPVINGLTDLVHPCQILADLQAVQEEFGPELRGRTVAWIGDGNNVANSWIRAARMLDFRLKLACPEGYDPDPEILAWGAAEGHVELLRDAHEAARGAHVITTDVWASMGQEEEQRVREAAFAGFQVDESVMDAADPAGIFLHCLPAHRGEEVTAGVIDGPRSRIVPEAHNRLHAQKALVVHLMR